jgi:spore maturation protein CgeB
VIIFVTAIPLRVLLTMQSGHDSGIEELLCFSFMTRATKSASNNIPKNELSELLMNWKETIKKWPLLYWINAKLSCYKLKRDLRRLKKDYEAKAASSGFSYTSDNAVEEFKSRHRRRCPNYIPAPFGSLRIFWVGTNRDQDESGFLQALHRLAKVTIFYNIEGNYGIWSGNTKLPGSSSFTNIRLKNDEALLEQIAHTHAKEGVNVLLCQTWANLISKESFARIQAMGIMVINISMDDRLPLHWKSQGDIRLGSVGLASALDMVLTTSPETCLWYGVESCPALYWPLASDAMIFSPVEGELRDIDVLFVGNKYGVRGQIVQYLENHGVKVDCYGVGWSNGYVNVETMAALSKRARIILGVGSIGHCNDVFTLKLRDFDAPMSGAMYLTNRNEDLCQLFVEGKEIECYSTPKEALIKIKFYLEHHAEMTRIARNGQQKAITRYNWDKRLLTTFEQLGLLQNTPPV